MKVLLFALTLVSVSAFAQDPVPTPVPTPVATPSEDSAQEQPKHIITIGTTGFGWSGMGSVFDWDKDKSGVKDHETHDSEMRLNYKYVLPNRFMIGAFVNFEGSTSEIKTVSGAKTKSEETDSEIGIGIGYNFNEDVYNSWWITAAVSSGNHEEETKDASGKENFEYGYNAFYLSVGKRFNLASWGLKNVSYNPGLTLAGASVDGDAEDAGLDGISQVTLDIIQIDILF